MAYCDTHWPLAYKMLIESCKRKSSYTHKLKDKGEMLWILAGQQLCMCWTPVGFILVSIYGKHRQV
uniref:Uncharacterized protein n=1 Tax=Dicentrarchus labrax TaxID=13489 RepID=A0A8C4H5Z9_DICLA